MSASDGERARDLSRRLAGAPAPQPAAPRIGVPLPDPSCFVSLRRAPRERGLPGPAPLPAHFGEEGWKDLLDWTLEATGSDAAFLMDPHGLVVACRGPLPAEEAEGLGARLMVALEQARRMAPAGEEELSMTIQFGEVTLTGFPVPLSDGTLLTAGLISRKPVDPASRRAVVRVLAAS